MQMRRLLLFWFWGRSNYSKWLRDVIMAHPGLCLLPPHPGPFNYPLRLLQMPPSPRCILQSTRSPPHPRRHRVSAAITFRITTQWEVNSPAGHLSGPITAGGQDEVKWHDLWDRWKRRGHKCIVNLWDICIKAWNIEGKEMLAWHRGATESTEDKCVMIILYYTEAVKK